MSELINIKDIDIYDNNRKSITPESLLELQASIKSSGLLQPVILRKKGKRFELIAGQRRFLACKANEMLQIPSTVREISDEEIPGIQLIENLQRADVAPMEEAVGFLNMSKNKSIEEISLLVGKPTSYVALRLKLNQLIPEYQKALKENSIDLKLAYEICKLEPKNQSELWKEEESNVGHYDIKRFLGNLNDTSFDTEDATLNKVRGACSTCPLNSANQNFLFPDQATEKRCMDISCFNGKTKVGSKKRVDQALTDPDLVLVTVEKTKEAEKIRKDGLAVSIATTSYYNTADFMIVDLPTLDELDRDDFDSDQEYKDDLVSEQKDYEEKLADFNKKLASGVIKKAMIVDGKDQGKMRFVTKHKGSKSSSGSKSSAAGSTDKVPSVKQQITAIEETIESVLTKEKRAKELDFEKVTEQIDELIKKKPYDAALEKPFLLSSKEMGAFIYHLMDDRGLLFNLKDILKVKESTKDNGDVKLMEALSNLTTEQMHMIFRNWLVEVCDETSMGINEHASEAHALRYVAEAVNLDVNALTEAQKQIAAARDEKVKKRIADLKAQIKKLQNPEKPAAKKAAAPAKNKSVKKLVA